MLHPFLMIDLCYVCCKDGQCCACWCLSVTPTSEQIVSALSISETVKMRSDEHWLVLHSFSVFMSRSGGQDQNLEIVSIQLVLIPKFV